jgi:hypothetical protein
MVGYEYNVWSCWNIQATGDTAGATAVVNLCDEDMSEEVRHFFFRMASVRVGRVKVD